MFRLADTPSRNVVQVLDRDGKDIKGQWLFVQSERPEVSGDTVIMFKESRAGATPAVQYWYFPGEKIGKEFIYPKDQATKIAARTGQEVRTDSGYVAPQEAGNRVDGAGLPPENTVSDNTPAPAPEPPAARRETPDTSSQVAVDTTTSSTQAVGTSGQAETQTARATTLPKTASPLAISGLIGLFSLAGALRARAARR
jgi:hypothetical protein